MGRVGLKLNHINLKAVGITYIKVSKKKIKTRQFTPIT